MSRREESRLTPAARAVADTREGVFIPVDLVRFTGDIVSAAFLRQLLYWFGTARDGYSRAQIRIKLSAKDRERGLGAELEEMLWLAKADDDWFEEIGLTYAQVKRVRAVFERDGWIISLTKRFAGTPTTHIAILPGLLEALEEWYSTPAEEKVKRQRLTLARSQRTPTSEGAESLSSEQRESGEAEHDIASPLANDASPLTSDVGASIAMSYQETTSSELDPPPPVASDDGADGQEGQARWGRKPKDEPCHPNYHASFDAVARAFGLDPVGLPDATRGKIQRARKGALGAGLLDDLQHLADVIWLYRGQPTGIPDIAVFGGACDRLAANADELRLIPHRAEATEIVTAAIERVPELAGHCKGVTRPQAECAIATALAAGHARGVIKTAMLTAPQWTKGTLLNEVGKCKAARFPGRGLPEIPADLSAVDPLQLVEWLKAADGHDVSVAPRLAEAIGRHLDAADLSNPDTIGDWRAVLRGDGWPRQGSVVFRLRGDLWDRLAALAAAGRQPAVAALMAGTPARILEGSTTP